MKPIFKINIRWNKTGWCISAVLGSVVLGAVVLGCVVLGCVVLGAVVLGAVALTVGLLLRRTILNYVIFIGHYRGQPIQQPIKMT